MKRRIITTATLILGMVFISTTLTAQAVVDNGVAKKKEPVNKELAWNKTKHVFGSIEHKVPVTADFSFTNNSKKPVVITKVGVTCGCTTRTYTQKPVQPGEKGSVKIKYDAVAPGFFKKGAKIHFSDGTAKEVEIEGKVVVRRQNIR